MTLRTVALRRAFCVITTSMLVSISATAVDISSNQLQVSRKNDAPAALTTSVSSITPPATDETPGQSCSSATVINTLPFFDEFDNSLNTESPPAGPCNSTVNGQMQNAEWYAWTPLMDLNAHLIVSPENDAYDCIVAIYNGSCGSLFNVACADEPQPIEIDICAHAGLTYYIEIGDYGAIPGGGVTFMGLETSPATGACCLQTGGCRETTQADCAGSSGNFSGVCSQCDSANCAPGGACCLPAGCAQRTIAACVAGGGVHRGIGTLCYDVSPENPVSFSANPNLPIPDLDDMGITSTISLSGTTVIYDLNVSVNIPNHTFISDLTVSLEHNNQTRILWNRECASENQLTVTFDDEAATTVCDEPMVGSIKPLQFGDGTLELFEQAPIAGDWTLIVSDSGQGDTGTLVSWSLTVQPGVTNCVQSCLRGDANCDGLVNNFDIDLWVLGLIFNGTNNAPAAYLSAGGTQTCWDLRECWGDITGSDGFSNFDIDPFVNCIVNLPPPGQPCPLP